MKNISVLLFFSFIITSFVFNACEKETFTSSPEDKLAFSQDTIMFDTVFTEIGSITKSFVVYNPHDQSIKISEIGLAKKNDFFHVNIDGTAIDKAIDIEILPNDSIYIFVEVTIDPNLPSSASPYIVEDDLIFYTNGNKQKVLLTAWGQNAVYLPYKNGGGNDYSLVCDMDGKVTWDDSRPYVIYGRLVIENCELVIPPGCNIYVHGGLGLAKIAFEQDSILIRYNDGAIIVYDQGKLTINGTVDNPVTIQGDRLDEAYEDKYGQWAGIILLNHTKNNTINHTSIKNAIRGIFIDSSSELSVKSSIIHNTLGSGIEATHATLSMENCLVYNNLSSSIQLTHGGTYNFDYCTFISEDNNSAAITAINYTCDDFSNCPFAVRKYNPLILNMRNNIIVGDQDDELIIINGTENNDPSFLQVNVNNSLISMKDLLETDFFQSSFTDCFANDDEGTLFFDKENSNYHLDTFSIAENKAIPINTITIDLDGEQRDGSTPDIGCFEFIQ